MKDTNRLEENTNLKTLERIDGKYIWNEISSVLNFDKGIFYTVKELIIRPGKTVKNFLLFDRKRIVKPVLFVILSSLIFVITQQIFEFNTGTVPENIKNPGVLKAFEWVGNNFGIVNVLLGFFIGLWIRLFFLKSKFNIFEIFILVFFTVGIGNLIFIIFGILETATGFANNNLTFFVATLYPAWAIGNFFNKTSVWSYFKGFLAYLFGTMTGSFLIVIIGILIDIFNKSS